MSQNRGGREGLGGGRGVGRRGLGERGVGECGDRWGCEGEVKER